MASCEIHSCVCVSFLFESNRLRGRVVERLKRNINDKRGMKILKNKESKVTLAKKKNAVNNRKSRSFRAIE